jgi:long-chain acyl-CoA synthetase
LTHTETKTVVCARRNLDKLCEVKRSGLCPKFDTAILIDGITARASELAQQAGLYVVSFAKVEAVGAERLATNLQPFAHSPPSWDDIATFSYTSGTTGAPKGALLTHGNLLSTVAGVHAVGGISTDLTDRHLSYLPLAHIFERIVMAQVLCAGASVAFYRGDPLLLVEDLQACRPTILPVAPRVLNKIYDKVNVWMMIALVICGLPESIEPKTDFVVVAWYRFTMPLVQVEA